MMVRWYNELPTINYSWGLLQSCLVPPAIMSAAPIVKSRINNWRIIY